MRDAALQRTPDIRSAMCRKQGGLWHLDRHPGERRACVPNGSRLCGAAWRTLHRVRDTMDCAACAESVPRKLRSTKWCAADPGPMTPNANSLSHRRISHRHFAVPHRPARGQGFRRIDDGVGVHAVVPIEVIDGAGLAEMLDPERL